MLIPHKFKTRPYQDNIYDAVVKDGVKRAVWIAHRRSGKEKVCLNIMIVKMLQRVGTYYYFFPSYNQARKILWEGMDRDGFRFMDHFPKELIENKNDQTMRLRLKNGSIFQLVGTDDIDSIVGTNPIGCVFSEYSIQKAEAWDYIRPILAENGGWSIFNFTPRGRNHGWKIFQQAKDNNWFVEVLTVEDTQAIPQEVLDQEKKEMPADLFQQEYYVRFIDGASAVFKNIDENLWSGMIDNAVISKRKFFLGVDLAKKQDFTVITPLDLTTFKVGKQDRFNQIDYNLQKAKISAAYYKWNKAHVRIDSTGVGEPIYDDLYHDKINVEPYHFTEQSRRDLLTNLQLKLEQGIIKIPDDEILISELKSFEYSVSPSGKLRMTVPEGLHDDCVMSLALAVWDMPHNKLSEQGQEERETLKQFDAFRNKTRPLYRI